MKRTPIKPKAKKCTECGTEFMPYKSTDKTCSDFDCKTAWALKVVRKQKANDWKAEKKVIREKLKTLSKYEAEAKKVFQKWVRLRDRDLPCISCGNANAKNWHASHYFDCNRFSGLIFNENNVHKSCDYCNVFLSGNLIEYRKGLIKRYGENFVSSLEEISDQKRIYKYSKQELIEIKNKYTLKSK